MGWSSSWWHVYIYSIVNEILIGVVLFVIFSFKAGLFRDKPYPRMLVGEESYAEPTKLERLSLREPNKQQWINEKVWF